MSLYAVSWVLYIVGIVLIGGGYLGLVSPGISWIGWLIGMLGWAMQFLPRYRRQPPSGGATSQSGEGKDDAPRA